MPYRKKPDVAAGAWEQRKQSSVLVGILHTDLVTLAWALGLRNLQVPGHIMPVTGMPYDHARNSICQKALEGGYQYVFMLDSDVVPPNDVILRLIRHNLPFVSGVYHRRSPPHGLPVMIKGPSWVSSYPANTLMEVDLVGSGCLLIRRDLLEALPPLDPQRGKKWFDWRVDMAGILPQGEALSEDFALCLHVRRTLGVKVMVDTSVQCRHVGLSQAGYNSMVPLECHSAT